MLLYTFGSAMCSFIVFLFCTECQASRISLCRHADDLSTISTLSKSIWWPLSIWRLANKEFLSNVAMAFACSFTRVFSARDVWPTYTQSQSLHLILYTIPLEASFSILSFGFLSILEMVRIVKHVCLEKALFNKLYRLFDISKRLASSESKSMANVLQWLCVFVVFLYGYRL